MLRSTIGRALAIITMLGALSASARTISYSGPCDGGGNWMVVLTIDDNNGRVTCREGVNCLSQYWRDGCGIHPASPVGLPTGSDHFAALEAGAWIRWNRDAKGDIVRMWGMTAAGDYWEADESQQSLQ